MQSQGIGEALDANALHFAAAAERRERVTAASAALGWPRTAAMQQDRGEQSFADREFKAAGDAFGAALVVSGRPATPRIPHIIWCFWHVPELPEWQARCVQSWRDTHPGFEIRILSPATIMQWMPPGALPQAVNRLGELCVRRFTDAVRCVLLAYHGGFWLDTGIFLLRRGALDALTAEAQAGGRTLALFYVHRPSLYSENWFLAAHPVNETMREWGGRFLAYVQEKGGLLDDIEDHREYGRGAHLPDDNCCPDNFRAPDCAWCAGPAAAPCRPSHLRFSTDLTMHTILRSMMLEPTRAAYFEANTCAMDAMADDGAFSLYNKHSCWPGGFRKWEELDIVLESDEPLWHGLWILKTVGDVAPLFNELLAEDADPPQPGSLLHSIVTANAPSKLGAAADAFGRLRYWHLDGKPCEPPPRKAATPRKTKRKEKACLVCGASGARSRCSGCRVARYCSPACQTKAWPAHRKVCTEMALGDGET